MRKFSKTFVATAVAAGLAAASFSGVASAQTKGLYPAGPVWINGYVSVNNVPKGGDYTDFACKVKGHGRIRNDGLSQIIIEGIQALHRSSGQNPRGCHFVEAWNFPWIVTINSQPVPNAPDFVTASTPDVTISGITFQAVDTGQPGCGTDDPGTIKAGAIWTQDVVPFVHPSGLPWHFTDPAYSTITLNNAEIQEDKIDGCLISGILKVTRPVAPSKATVAP